MLSLNELKNFSCFSVPSAPSGVTGYGLSTSSIRVSWANFASLSSNSSSVYNTSEIVGYTVSYREALIPTQEWTRVAILKGSYSLDLVDLKSFTTYTIRVMAFIRTGYGIPSSYIDVRTLEGGNSFRLLFVLNLSEMVSFPCITDVKNK